MVGCKFIVRKEPETLNPPQSFMLNYSTATFRLEEHSATSCWLSTTHLTSPSSCMVQSAIVKIARPFLGSNLVTNLLDTSRDTFSPFMNQDILSEELGTGLDISAKNIAPLFLRTFWSMIRRLNVGVTAEMKLKTHSNIWYICRSVVKWLRLRLSIERSDVRGPPWSVNRKMSKKIACST